MGGKGWDVMPTVSARERIGRYVNNPWDQQPGESAKQFARFTEFATTAVADRNLSELARKHAVSPSTMWEVAERFRWRERAALWDAQRLRSRREAIAEKETQLAERAVSLALVSAGIIGRSLRALADGKTVLDPKDLPAFAKMVETFRKMAVDAPDAVITLGGGAAGTRVDVPDFEGMTDDQIRDRAAEMARSVLRLVPGGKSA